MKYRVNSNPVEIAFYQWISQFPESFHPCDRNRFYRYVFTALHYKEGAPYFQKKYFYEKCISYGLRNKDDIESYWIRQCHVSEIENCKAPFCRKKMVVNHEIIGPKYDQAYIINNKYYCLDITEKEYKKGGLSKRDFIKRINKELK